MIYIYKILLYLLLIPVLPILPFIWLFSEKRRANLLQRFGFQTGFAIPETGKKRIWIHALSVGEVISSVPFVKEVKARQPEYDIVFTASTRTGFATVERLLKKGENPAVDHLGYFPFDLGLSISRLRKKIRPDAVVIVETDLWPNFLYEMKKYHIPVVLINARMSLKSLKGYRRFRRFFALFFGSLAEIMVQSDLDRQRFESLGIGGEKLTVTGNIKFDQPVAELSDIEAEELLQKLGLMLETLVLIGGSTHTGEEKILLDAYKTLKYRFQSLVLILAPRDPDRAGELESLCRSHDLPSRRFSKVVEQKDLERDDAVILVDRMGVLAKLYAVCSTAFIGGSMVKRGGHNPLEAAALSKPVLFGDDMTDFLEISDLLTQAGAARQVMDSAELEKALVTLLESPGLRKEMGRKGFELFCRHSGAVNRIIARLEKLNIV